MSRSSINFVLLVSAVVREINGMDQAQLLKTVSGAVVAAAPPGNPLASTFP